MERWSFAHTADIHIGSPHSYRFQPSWNENWQTAKRQILELAPELLLVGGDLTRDGNVHRFELEAVKRELDSLPFPAYAVPGNMDTGNKHTTVPSRHRDDISLNVRSEHLAQFASIFGQLWWSFTYRDVRFIGVCDVVIGSSLPEERELWRWLSFLRRGPTPRHSIWVMHYAPFIENPEEPDFDITDPAQYHCWYFSLDKAPRMKLLSAFREIGADIVISAHIHCRRVQYFESIRYHKAPSTAFSQWKGKRADGDPMVGFLLYTVSADGIDYRFVPLKKLSKKKGYGPGGHPPPEARDYSLAWEKDNQRPAHRS